MFDQMRKNTKTILWITVIAFVGLIFLGWGLQFSGGGKSQRRDPNTIGSVNGVPIASRAYELAVTQARARYQEQAGRDVDDRAEVMIRNQTWGDLVQEMLLQQEVQKQGISVTDEEVVQAVMNQPPPDVQQSPNFQTNGRFDLAKYQAALRNPNVDTRGMEEQYRTSLPLQKLQMQVVGSIAISDAEMFDAYQAQNEKIKASFLLLPASKFTVDEAAIGQADLERYYQAHRNSYKQPPTAVLEYIAVPRRHTEQDSLNLMEQARSVMQELKGGEDFLVLVDAYSEATPSMRGGDAAVFLKAAQIPDAAVREAAFALQVGQNSDLMVTPSGLHIVKLLDKKTDPAGDEVKIADIQMALKPSPETLTQLRDTAQQFRQEVEKRDFAEVAKEMKLAPRETGPFTETGFITGLGSAPELQDFAFRFKVGTISPPVERPEGWVVAKIRDRREARVADLKEIQDRVRSEVADSLRVDQAVQAAAGLLQRAQSGTPLSQLASADPRATFDTTDPFPRLGYAKGIGNDAAVIGALFDQPVGLCPKVLRGRTAAFVVSIDQKTPVDKDQFEAQKTQQRQQLMQRKQGQLMNDWLAQLKKKAKIEDFRFGLYDF